MKSSLDPRHQSDSSEENSDDDVTDPGSSTSLYQYGPLSPGEIRVLVLLEADDLDDDLECDLLTLPLDHFDSAKDDDEDASFSALSYVWGTSRNTRIAYVGDKYMKIGRNLESALRYLRRRDRHTLLWVDAMCINQSDVQERNHQVQQMREIYEHAHETVAYLGDCDDGNVASSAWNYLERNSTWAWNENQEKNFDIPKLREAELHFRGDLYDVFHTVLTRPWFQRVWVFQEAVVSKQLSIQSGRRRVPWDDFIKSTILPNRVHDRYGQSLGQTSRFDYARHLWQARVAFHETRNQEQYLPGWHTELTDLGAATSTDMLDMLVLARSRWATDPRDKVFALLGISTGFDWQSKGTVDYDKSTAEVYKNFAIDYMTSKKDYRILSYLNKVSRPEFFLRQGRRWRQARRRLVENLGTKLGAHVEEEDGDALYGENITEQVPMQSEWLAAEGTVDVFPTDYLRPAAQTCSRSIRGLEQDLEGYEDFGSVPLPTWVPNWDCRHQLNHEPRAIVELADPVRASTIRGSKDMAQSEPLYDVESFRTWVKGYGPGGQIVPSGTLAVQGRVLGKLVRAMSSASLLGRDESAFSELRKQWQKHKELQTFPLEAHIMSVWASLLLQSTDMQKLDGEDVGHHNPELSRKFSCAVDAELTKSPYATMGIPFNWEMPPQPGSIEAHLVERAEMGNDWSTDSVASSRVVAAPASIIDQRLIGLYRATELDPQNPQPRQVFLQENYEQKRLGLDLGPEKLVLLPPEAKFGDLVVMFPGAKVPFLVRNKRVCKMEDRSTRKVHRGNLPHIETAKLYVECALLGECWVNEYAELAKEDQVFDTVFSVQ